MADHILPHHDGSQSITGADSESHAGYSRRSRRGGLDELARARSALAQAPAGAGSGRSAGGAAGLAAGEQRQERGSGTPGGFIVIWPIAEANDVKRVKTKVGFVEPMLSLPVAKLPQGSAWSYEL